MQSITKKLIDKLRQNSEKYSDYPKGRKAETENKIREPTENKEYNGDLNPS